MELSRGLPLWITAVLALFSPRQLAAQCPDGTPPPCDVRWRTARPRPQPPAAAERGRRFLVLPFRNITRSPQHEWLVEGSPALLADALRQWQEISVVPDERLYPALRRHGLVPGTVPDLARVRRVAEETGGWTAVVGEVLFTPPTMQIRARAYDMATERELVYATEEVSASGDVRTAYSRIGTELLRLAGLDSASADIVSATTRSLDAYRAYLRGLAYMSRGQARQAQGAFEEAVRRDNGFAQAYARLALAAAWGGPEALFERNSPVFGHIDRAAAQSARLPPRDRQLVQALQAGAQGRLGDARQLLERLAANDSTDLEVLRLLADFEFYDPILVAASGGERPRGSLNVAARLAKRVLDLDSTQHQAYRRLVETYTLAGGAGRGMVVGVRGERASLAELVSASWDRVFLAVLRDSIELVPAESLDIIPRDSLAAYRRSAVAIASSWVGRWLATAPGEAEAHLAASYVYEAADQPDSALRALDRADSLGVETGLEHVPLRRLALLVQAGRHRDALRYADRLIETMTPRDLATPSVERTATVIRAMGSLFSLYLITGRTGDAGRLLGLVGRRFGGEGPALRRVLFSPRPFENPRFALPSRMRVEAAESALARSGEGLPGGAVGRLLPDVVELAMTDADPRDHSRLAARAADVATRLAGQGAQEQAVGLAAVAAADPVQRARLEREPWYRP